MEDESLSTSTVDEGEASEHYSWGKDQEMIIGDLF